MLLHYLAGKSSLPSAYSANRIVNVLTRSANDEIAVYFLHMLSTIKPKLLRCSSNENQVFAENLSVDCFDWKIADRTEIGMYI